jgi:UDP-2,3-diacylglucosamine hydrolase
MTSPTFHELRALPAWRSVDFISDLHLHESEPTNFLAWRRYLETSTADAIFILGDLFEVWVGDDVLRLGANANNANELPALNLAARHEGLPFEERCRRVLHYCAQSKPVYFMHGNRDFLLGPAALQACGMQLLPDPTLLSFGGLRYLLSHGDELCLSDTDYQQFRRQVRSPQWQAEFLAHPLPKRQQIARDLRAQSEARKKAGGPWVDVDSAEAERWMQAARADHMVHGHTHEGADHSIANGKALGSAGTRHVLCDWHAEATPPRAQALRLSLTATGQPGSVTAQRLSLDATAT